MESAVSMVAMSMGTPLANLERGWCGCPSGCSVEVSSHVVVVRFPEAILQLLGALNMEILLARCNKSVLEYTSGDTKSNKLRGGTRRLLFLDM